MIEKYLKNKETKITDDDLDITSLENDLRKGYVSEKDVQGRIDTAVKTANTDATTKYSQLENTYNDTVKTLSAVNEKNATLSLQMKMMKHGFKEENFDEISKLRKSLYADEKDDEKAIAGIAEKFKGTYFKEADTKPETPPDGEFKSNSNEHRKDIKITRNTSLSDLFYKKGE